MSKKTLSAGVLVTVALMSSACSIRLLGKSKRHPSNGEDIRQLHQNLADLGFYKEQVGLRYDRWTREAVKRWQKSLGLEQNSVFDPGRAVVAPSLPIRIERVTSQLGQSDVSPAIYTDSTVGGSRLAYRHAGQTADNRAGSHRHRGHARR
ncbi:MAG: hypothetical protein CSA82_03535 [Actinobacteria bacterium]|nr:MAG: hypothetical protein CSA82_03535 [Actinomycetota bacterium]